MFVLCIQLLVQIASEVQNHLLWLYCTSTANLPCLAHLGSFLENEWQLEGVLPKLQSALLEELIQLLYLATREERVSLPS